MAMHKEEVSQAQDSATVHGTQKSVECMLRPMLNNSSPGQAVFEPFMGSNGRETRSERCLSRPAAGPCRSDLRYNQRPNG